MIDIYKCVKCGPPDSCTVVAKDSINEPFSCPYDIEGFVWEEVEAPPEQANKPDHLNRCKCGILLTTCPKCQRL